METSWYILSTIVILAVLIDGSHGLSCYNCTSIADITSCKQVVQCNTDEICRYSVVSTQPSPNIIGRDMASQVACNECCSIDNCNSHLCKTGAQSLNQAKCVDDPEFDCQQFDAFLHLCSDITHAKQKCQRYCGLCTIVDGSWSSWHSWSSCDRTCGNRTLIRTRTCDTPAPQDGGLLCPDVDHETTVCDLGKCPVHGGWATWSSWGSCSATCGMGLQRRDRSCSHPYPGPDGNPCFGDYRDDRACFDGACADAQNGGWSGWSSWSHCLNSYGEQTRTRSCTNPQPSGFGRACSGTDWQTYTCSLGIRLVHGTSSHNGRVEVLRNGQWGTVCDDSFTDKSAKVVCWMLGLPTTTTYQYQKAHFGQGTGPIWLNNVACIGTEHSILDCLHTYTGSSITTCSHGEDVGVYCA